MDKIYYYLSAALMAAFLLLFYLTRNSTTSGGKTSQNGTVSIVQSPTILAKNSTGQSSVDISGYSASPSASPIESSQQTFIVPNVYTPGYSTMPFVEPTGISGYSTNENVIQLQSVPQTDGYNTFPTDFQPPVGQSIEPPIEPVVTTDPIVQPIAPEMQMPI